MNRRDFVTTGVAAAASPLAGASAQAATPQPAYIELRKFLLRNTVDNEPDRLTDFVGKALVPALSAAGVGPIGLFAPLVAADAPFLLLIAQHASLDGFDKAHTAVWADAGVQAKAAQAQAGGRLFERMEVTLLRAFSVFPKIEATAREPQPARVFELRRYESDTPLTLRRKIAMFEQGEIEIFRKAGFSPVFFSEQVAGAHMSNLTYMLACDSLAAREANWRAFAASPEWQKMKATPGWSNGEVVSNISNFLLGPVSGSQIR